MILHAGCLAWRRDGAWAGVLVTGPSGVGKSDLALRLMSRGWRLVADDRAVVWRSGDALFAAAAPPLAGLVEARGLDILHVAARALTPVRLVVDCLPQGRTPERLPEPELREIEGVRLPAIAVNALEASATVKLEMALARQGRLV